MVLESGLRDVIEGFISDMKVRVGGFQLRRVVSRKILRLDKISNGDDFS